MAVAEKSSRQVRDIESQKSIAGNVPFTSASFGCLVGLSLGVLLKYGGPSLVTPWRVLLGSHLKSLERNPSSASRITASEGGSAK